jgi:hypothetical protein
MQEKCNRSATKMQQKCNDIRVFASISIPHLFSIQKPCIQVTMMAYLINGKLKVGSLTVHLKQSRGNEVQKGELQNLVSCPNIGIATAQMLSTSIV